MTKPSFVVELETLRHLQGPVRPVGELSRRGIAAWRQGLPCCASNSKLPRTQGSKGPLSTSPHLSPHQARPPEAPPPRHRTKIVAHSQRNDHLLGDLRCPLACGLGDTAVRRTDTAVASKKAKNLEDDHGQADELCHSFFTLRLQCHRSRSSILQITCASNCASAKTIIASSRNRDPHGRRRRQQETLGEQRRVLVTTPPPIRYRQP